jgi:hypothetical protein
MDLPLEHPKDLIGFQARKSNNLILLFHPDQPQGASAQCNQISRCSDVRGLIVHEWLWMSKKNSGRRGEFPQVFRSCFHQLKKARRGRSVYKPRLCRDVCPSVAEMVENCISPLPTAQPRSPVPHLQDWLRPRTAWLYGRRSLLRLGERVSPTTMYGWAPGAMGNILIGTTNVFVVSSKQHAQKAMPKVPELATSLNRKA